MEAGILPKRQAWSWFDGWFAPCRPVSQGGGDNDKCEPPMLASFYLKIGDDDSAVSVGRVSARGSTPGVAGRGDISFRSSTPRRRRLALRVQRWVDLTRQVAARRLLIDGSFVTAKAEPDDVDAVVLLPKDFQRQVDAGIEAALELEQMVLTRHPGELFAAEDETDWDEWVEFFGRTREADGRRKGMVEVGL